MFEPSHLIAVSPSGRALIRRKTALPARQVVESRFIISSARWKQTESACFVGHTHSLVILSAGGRWEILLRHVWWKYAEQSRGINENTGDCGGLDWNSSPASTSRSFSPWSAAECFKWTHFWNSSDFGGALWKFEVRQHSHRVLLCNGDWHWKRGTGRKTRSQEEAGLLIHHRRRPFSSRPSTKGKVIQINASCDHCVDGWWGGGTYRNIKQSIHMYRIWIIQQMNMSHLPAH